MKRGNARLPRGPRLPNQTERAAASDAAAESWIANHLGFPPPDEEAYEAILRESWDDPMSSAITRKAFQTNFNLAFEEALGGGTCPTYRDPKREQRWAEIQNDFSGAFAILNRSMRRLARVATSTHESKSWREFDHWNAQLSEMELRGRRNPAALQLAPFVRTLVRLAEANKAVHELGKALLLWPGEQPSRRSRGQSVASEAERARTEWAVRAFRRLLQIAGKEPRAPTPVEVMLLAIASGEERPLATSDPEAYAKSLARWKKRLQRVQR